MHVGTTPPSKIRLATDIARLGRCDHRSGLERAAGSTAQVGPGRPAILASLILAGLPRREADDTEVLWPIWASEAVYRAEGLLTLLALLDRSRRRGPGRLGRQLDVDLARSLASQFQALQSGPTRAPVPCSPILRDIAAALLSLFGEVVGGPVLRTDIARLVLPGFQRRALVLASSTLVIGVLVHGIGTPGLDLIDITLQHDERLARLRVTVQDQFWPASQALEAAGAMADLLEGELLLDDEGRRVEIVFPLPTPLDF